jgi:hypothetical protein
MGPRPYSQVGTTVFRKLQKYMIRQTRNYHAILNRYKKRNGESGKEEDKT